MLRFGHRTLQRAAFALFVGLAVVATVQRGLLSRSHATFPIFRQSFAHLSEGADLYARYPLEQGTEARDRFKYNPSAALGFAPLSMLPFVAGLFAWTLLNSLGLYAALRRLFPERDATIALFIVFPALVAAVQSTSSNGLVAALIVGAFVALEAGQRWRAAAAIAAGTLMKLFPAAMLPFALIRRDRVRLLGVIALVFVTALGAPLLVTSPAELLTQYRSWLAILLADEGDLTFARSIMVVVREFSNTEGPNWVFQSLATMALVTPLAVRPSAWTDAAFRRSFLASLLVYVVIFNHQSENASYVIASVGLALWFLSAPATVGRVTLLVACMAGLEAVPYFLVWIWMQFELLRGEVLVAALRSRLRARLRARLRTPLTGGTIPVALPVGVAATAVLVVALVSLRQQATFRSEFASAPAEREVISARAVVGRRRPSGGPRGAARPSAVATLKETLASLVPESPTSRTATVAGVPAVSEQSPVLLPEVFSGLQRGATIATIDRTQTTASVESPMVSADEAACVIDTLGTSVPDAWLATRVGRLRIETGGVELPTALLSNVASRLHVATRDDVVRQQLTFRPGEQVDSTRILESVRRLRESSLFSDVMLEGRRCGGQASTDFSLRTRDAWSTRASVQLGGRAPAQAFLLEGNILGSGRTISLGSEEIGGHRALSAAVADPYFLGAPIAANAAVRSYGDGREWAWSLRTRERSPRDDWRATFTSTQIRRFFADSARRLVTDIARRANVLVVSRRIVSSDAAVWAITSGVEQEQSALAVTRTLAALGGGRANRAFVAPLVGFSRRSTTFRTIDWLVPGQRPSELRVGVEGDVVAAFGRETHTGGAVAHWDGWTGVTAMPTPGTVITADLWTSGYQLRDTVANASVRTSATVVQRAKRGLWIGRASMERLWRPDPDVFALSTADAMLRTLSPTSRLAVQALSVQAERSAPLYASEGRWAIDGALFATWSKREHTLDVAGNPVRAMEAGMFGVGLRQVRSDPRQSPLKLDIGRTFMRSRGLQDRWVVTLSASPSLGGKRSRDGLRAPGR